MVFIIASVLALLTFFLVILLVAYVRYVRRRNLFSRMEKFKVIEANGRSEDSGQQSILERTKLFLERMASPFSDYASMQSWDIKMRQAGIPLMGGEFVVAALLCSVVIGIAVWMLFLDGFIAFLASIANLVLLRLILSIRVGMRRNAFTEQLGDALTTMSNALRAGYSFQQAVDAIATEMEPPISEEFSQVMREVSMGVPLETSLEAMNKRVGSSDFELVVTAVIIQREVGGNLAQILDTISDTIGERIRMKREIFALTAQGRLSALILFLLPFGIGFFMYCANPDQILMLFNDQMGRIALGVSFLLELIGIFVINRIVNIKL